MTVKDAEAERLAEIIAELRRIKVPTLYTGVVFEATELLQGILTDTQKGAIAWPSRATS